MWWHSHSGAPAVRLPDPPPSFSIPEKYPVVPEKRKYSYFTGLACSIFPEIVVIKR